MNPKKMWPALSLFLLTCANVVHANVDNAQMRNLENRVNALEQRRGSNSMINPPARPQVKNGADLFVTGDLLVWQARENGLGLATLSTSPTTITNGKVRNIHNDWDVGFRIGLGYNVPHDGWDLSLTWLRFYTNGHRNTSTTDNYFYPKLLHPSANLSDNPCRKVRGHWKMHLNQLDLDLGREFFVSKWLTLRPHFGLRSDWIQQRLSAHYKRYPFVFSSQTDTVKMKDHWWGIGLEGGLDTQWGLGGGWSIYGNLSAAILYGFHDLSQSDDETVFTNNDQDLKSSYHISHPVLDMQLGLRWDHMFCNDRFHIGIQTGWEHHIYFSQNQLMYFVDDVDIGSFVSNQGDLTMEGWTLSVRFDF